MTDNLDRWTTFALSQISHGARFMQEYMGHIESGMTNLPYRRHYTTEAEAKLEELEDSLSEMLARVRSVLREYEAKPFHVKQPDEQLREDCRLLSMDAAE